MGGGETGLAVGKCCLDSGTYKQYICYWKHYIVSRPELLHVLYIFSSINHQMKSIWLWGELHNVVIDHVIGPKLSKHLC